MAWIDKEAEAQLSAVCEFCTTAQPTGLHVEMLFQRLKEVKAKGLWQIEEARSLKSRLRSALKLLVKFLFMQGAKIKIESDCIESYVVRSTKDCINGVPDVWKTTVNWDFPVEETEERSVRLVTRITNDLNDEITLHIQEPDADSSIPHDFPLITFKIIELLLQLPENTLRICSSSTCENPFISRHKTKKYCSATCRSRENIYATRRRLKERLKDAD
jgi:hypothetical protein